AEDEVRALRRMLLRQPPAEGATGAIDRAAENAAVGAREVDELEDAALRFLSWKRMRRAHPPAVDDDDFTRLDVPEIGRADDVERAGLGGKNERVAELAHRKGTPSERVAHGHEGVAEADDETVRPFDAVEGFRNTLLRL